MSQRPIYLVVDKSRLFAAHWAMWIPPYDAEMEKIGNIGKLINVRGDPRNGFNHEFVRNYNISMDTGKKEVILIGWTNEANVKDGTTQRKSCIDTQANDVMEELALSIEAPDPSLRSAASPLSGSRTRVRIQNCQTWMVDFVAILVRNKILDEKANTIVAEAPKN